MAAIKVINPEWTPESSGIEKWIHIPISAEIKEGTMTYKGSKGTTSELPNTGNEKGDLYTISEDSTTYLWDGSEWKLVGGTSEISSDKVTSLTGYVKATSPDSIKDTDTLNVALGKLEKIIEDNKEVAARALVDLDSRIKDIVMTISGVEASVSSLEDASK